ncbi:osmoprotectant transport system permease protein [Haloactinopolyspora alba]|uniref:Osmoprotectant transport system permease protein n=1 Tax=Haloactinopolyspora alba TaxID=648780 RepID=A0A2P8DZ18_9ACTN|nr:ABC transporter permease [Haloactinopolyspora alba]PSL02427.1 osmoprotectant transport system permease protein [Haloactinopolyspora alba]
MDALIEAFGWFGDGANWQGRDGVPTRLWEHVWVVAVSLGLACAVALPIGLWLGHVGRGGTLAINISNVGRAVPTFAVLVLLFLTPLGLSVWTTILALVAFALPPILTNTYVGMREVDPDARSAALGMGMNGLQVVRKVELPLAVPLIMTGVRLAAVQVVATATLAAFVSGPGLGRIITSGFGRQDVAQIVAGAILVAALALVVEALMEWLQRAADPVRRARQRSSSAASRRARGSAAIEVDRAIETGS